MPELPEVETILLGLKPRVVGSVIRDVLTNDVRVLQVTAKHLKHNLPLQTIQKLSRRGKYLIFELDRHYLIFHFGMTGQLTYRDPHQIDSKGFVRHPITGLEFAHQHSPDQHTHLRILLDKKKSLLYRDVRKFGRIFLLQKSSKNPLKNFFVGLGMEPFTSKYNLKNFFRHLYKSKSRLKSLLLDQKFVAGIGNIYADEALFEAGIHPAKKVNSLRKKEKVKLFRAIPKVLERGITLRGTTFRDYVNSDGNPGSNQEELKVYGRQGENCYQCQSTIQKIVINQRGTHFCPTCQP